MKFKATIETLTPLHIGSGTEFINQFDYQVVGETTYMLNSRQIYLDELLNKGASARFELPAAHLISADRLQEGSPFVRYALKGAAHYETLHEQIKTVYDQAYLPGSSLKGALRTGLLSFCIVSGLIKHPEVKFENKGRGFKKEIAAELLEKEAFNPRDGGPNTDLLRVLQVSDSVPLPVMPSPFALCSVRVFGASQANAPIEVEAVSRGVVFETELLVDELALQYSSQLGWKGREWWLASILPILQRLSDRRIADEIDFANAYTGAAKFYRSIQEFSRKLAGQNAAVLQMGWGTGWNGTTVGSWLPKPLQNEIRQKFELGRPQNARNWSPNLAKPFPASRRYRSSGSNVSPVAGSPLGWVAISLEPMEDPSPYWQNLVKEAQAEMARLDNLIAASHRPSAIPVLEKTATAAPDAGSPVRPSDQKPAPASLPGSHLPVKNHFVGMPVPGDIFSGKVYDIDEKGIIYVVIADISPEVALGEIQPVDAPPGVRINNNAKVICEAISLGIDQEEPDFTMVHCRILER